MKTPLFITGNQDKADYLAKTLGIPIEHVKLELDEIQSVDIDEIVRHKVRHAYDRVQKPVLVEDVALCFTALGELPGPFIKFFVDIPDGLEKLCRMLDGFEDRTATARCTFGYYDGEEMMLLRGSLKGEIAQHARGESGFGWDKIFIPEGYGNRTRAELYGQDDTTTYATIKPFDALRDFLNT